MQKFNWEAENLRKKYSLVSQMSEVKKGLLWKSKPFKNILPGIELFSQGATP